jgi:hypothetical protein
MAPGGGARLGSVKALLFLQCPDHPVQGEAGSYWALEGVQPCGTLFNDVEHASLKLSLLELEVGQTEFTDDVVLASLRAQNLFIHFGWVTSQR